MENNKEQIKIERSNRILDNFKKTVVPLEVSTAWIDDPELLESCRHLHAYVNDAYDDISENPAENFRDYQNSLSWIGCLHLFKTTLSRCFYSGAEYAEPDSIIINTKDYDKIYKSIENKYIKEILSKNPSFPEFKEYFSSLKRRGIKIYRTENETVITNIKYPKMFLAMTKLHEATVIYHRKRKYGRSFGFDNLDFRHIQDPFRKHEFEDLFIPLTPAEVKMTRELLCIIEKNNLKCKFHTGSVGKDFSSGDYVSYCDVDEKHRDRRGLMGNPKRIPISSFSWKYNFDKLIGYIIEIFLPEPWDEPLAHETLTEEIDKLENADEIKDFCAKAFFSCGGCHKSCADGNIYKMDMKFLGRKMPKLPRGCSKLRIRFNPDAKNIDMAKTLIALLAEIYKYDLI